MRGGAEGGSEHKIFVVESACEEKEGRTNVSDLKNVRRMRRERDWRRGGQILAVERVHTRRT